MAAYSPSSPTASATSDSSTATKNSLLPPFTQPNCSRGAAPSTLSLNSDCATASPIATGSTSTSSCSLNEEAHSNNSNNTNTNINNNINNTASNRKDNNIGEIPSLSNTTARAALQSLQHHHPPAQLLAVPSFSTPPTHQQQQQSQQHHKDDDTVQHCTNMAASVAQWLDHNPHFASEYFVKKATRSMVEAWRAEQHRRSFPASASSSSASTSSPSATASVSTSPFCGSSGGGIDCSSGPACVATYTSSSGSNTPVRKISSQEFHPLGFRPILTVNSEGRTTFIIEPQTTQLQPHTTSSSPSASSPIKHANQNATVEADSEATSHVQVVVTGARPTHTPAPAAAPADCVAAAPQLMRELIMDVVNDLDLTSLIFKILQNVGRLVCADRCSLFLVEQDWQHTQHTQHTQAHESGQQTQNCEEEHRECAEEEETGSTPRLVLRSRLFDVTQHSKLAETLARCQQEHCSFQVEWGQGIAGHVAQSGQYEKIDDVYQDSRFIDSVDKKTGYRTRSLLCMPIKDADGSVLGVVQAVNKLASVASGVTATVAAFTQQDVEVFESYLAICGMSIKNAQLFQQSHLETKRNQVLLDLAQLIFEQQSDMNQLMFKILMHTISLLHCQRCQLLLLDLDSDVSVCDCA